MMEYLSKVHDDIETHGFQLSLMTRSQLPLGTQTRHVQEQECSSTHHLVRALQWDTRSWPSTALSCTPSLLPVALASIHSPYHGYLNMDTQSGIFTHPLKLDHNLARIQNKGPQDKPNQNPGVAHNKGPQENPRSNPLRREPWAAKRAPRPASRNKGTGLKHSNISLRSF